MNRWCLKQNRLELFARSDKIFVREAQRESNSMYGLVIDARPVHGSQRLIIADKKPSKPSEPQARQPA